MKKRVFVALIVLLLFFSYILAFAHSGRTDKNGGHRDNKNVSGLGPYHYHCGGYPPHLHNDGYCKFTGEVFPTIAFPGFSNSQEKPLSEVFSTKTPKPTIKATRRATNTPEPTRIDMVALAKTYGLVYTYETPKPTLSPEEIKAQKIEEQNKRESQLVTFIIGSALFGPALWLIRKVSSKDN